MATKKGFVRLSFTGFLSIISWISAVSLLFSVLASYVNPSDAPLVSVFGLLFPLFIIANLLILILWIVLKHYLILLHVTMLLLSIPIATKYFTVQKGHSGVKDFTIMTYNVHGFRGNQFDGTASEISQLVSAFIRNQQADIVCIQEYLTYSQNPKEELAAFVDNCGYKYYHFVQYWTESGNKLEGLLTMAQEPISNKGQIPVSDQRTFASWASLDPGVGENILVFNIHLASFRLKQAEVDFIGDGKLFEKEQVRALGSPIIEKFVHSFTIRAKETHQLIATTDTLNMMDMILAGDFNDSPSSFTYRRIKNAGFNDSFHQTGFGFGATYAGNIPFQRIDYLFSSENLVPVSSAIFKNPYSNHYAFSACFSKSSSD